MAISLPISPPIYLPIFMILYLCIYRSIHPLFPPSIPSSIFPFFHLIQSSLVFSRFVLSNLIYSIHPSIHPSIYTIPTRGDHRYYPKWAHSFGLSPDPQRARASFRCHGPHWSCQVIQPSQGRRSKIRTVSEIFSGMGFGHPICMHGLSLFIRVSGF